MSASRDAWATPRGARGGAGARDLARGSWQCPVCGRGEWWCRVSTDGAVAWCRNVADGSFATTQNAGGAEYLHRLTGESRARAVVAARSAPAAGVAPLAPVDLDAMHRWLLAVHLRLPAWARAIVRDTRGLTDDEIAEEGYGYLPREGRARIARALLDRFGLDAMRLPGMRIATDASTGATHPTLGGAVGLVVPCRTLVDGDGEPRVVALKVRSLDPSTPREHRFTYVSSARHGGSGAIVSPHYPMRALALRAAGHRDVMLVESEIAATVCTAITDRPAVAVAGAAGAPRFAVAVARAWPAEVVRVCLDRDESPATRARIAAHARDAIAALLAAGVDARLLTVPPPAKGPDDHLRARHRPRTLTIAPTPETPHAR